MRFNRHNRNINAFAPNQNLQNNRHLNTNGQNLNHILFTTSKVSIPTPTNSTDYLKKSITLFDPSSNIKFLEVAPRNFIITTNNGSYSFNTEVLKNTSSVISKFLIDNPQNLQYHLDINDEGNVLQKFEKLYQGTTVFFQESDILVYRKIRELLKINSLPNYIKQQPNTNQRSFTFEMKCDIADGLKFEEISFNKFIKENIFKKFTITTRKKEYKCNIFGILSSKVILDLLAKDPNTNNYFYDIDDDSDEFQIICDLFNFETISITQENMYYLKEAVENFQINYISSSINKIIATYEKSLNEMDDQIIVDVIEYVEELFEWLYNIKTITVPKVKQSILKSNWIKSEEKVQELAAFILQVIKTDIQLHRHLLDLLEELNNESSQHNSLKILIPFINNQLLLNFSTSNANCSFVYNLYKRKFISDNELIEKLKKKKNEDFTRLWFLPELVENELVENEDDQNQFNLNRNRPQRNLNQFRPQRNELSSTTEFIKLYYPDNIDSYKRMRDNGEPDDTLTKAIRDDDVDTVQSIVSKNIVQGTNLLIPRNIFEVFVPNGSTNYIDYSAAYGSIKCFKYFLLNHHEVTDETFRLALFGGNTEIIKIIDQNLSGDNNQKFKQNFGNQNPPRNMGFQNAFVPVRNRVPMRNTKSNFTLSLLKKISPSIIKHRNDIFDWIFENKFNNDSDKPETLFELIKLSAENGNIHSLVGIIDKGFDPIENSNAFRYLINIASQNGFYELTTFLSGIINPKFKGIRDYSRKKQNKYILKFQGNEIQLSFDSFVLFGNLNIFKIGLETKVGANDLEKAFVTACKMNHTKIIDYFFNELFEKKFKISNNGIKEALISSIKIMRIDLFDYLLKQYEQLTNSTVNVTILNQLLNTACEEGNLEVAKKVTALILNTNSKFDATCYFITAASVNFEICKFFFNQKLDFDYAKILSNDNKLGSISKEIFCKMIEKVDQSRKYQISTNFLFSGVKRKNIELVDYLLNEGFKYDDILIDAVRSHNLELVNVVLKYNSKPSFINTKRANGTALFWAVYNNDCPIIERLLSIPGIDANLPNNQGTYPLLHACITNKCKAVQILLKSGKVNPNLYSYVNGNSILMNTISCQNEKVAKFLIDYPETDINTKNYDNQSALILASTSQQPNIINALLASEKFDPEESRLNHAFYLATGDALNSLIISESLDVNYRCSFQTNKNIRSYNYTQFNGINMNNNFMPFRNESLNEAPYESTLVHAVKNHDLNKVCLILQNPNFDKIKSDLNEAINISSSFTSEADDNMYKKLVEYIEIDENYFEIALRRKNIRLLKAILNNPSFKISYHIVNEIFSQVSYFPINQIKPLIIMVINMINEHKDIIDINQFLSNGVTIFSFVASLAVEGTEEIVQTLLVGGADPNIPDKFGFYPLQIALQSKNLNLVSEIMKSDKIDYSKKILKFIKNNKDKPKYQSYLHLAAELGNIDAVTTILNSNLIDINITDDDGNTPFILAVKNRHVNIINELFLHDELDYLHRNNQGNDALSFTKYKKVQQDQQIEDKNVYYQLIMNNL